MFKLPEPTYPLSIDTIGKMLALGMEINCHCNAYGCGHKARVNLVAVARIKGIDYSCMHDDLVKVIYCPKCRDAGRPDRNLSFTNQIPGNHSKWKAKGS